MAGRAGLLYPVEDRIAVAIQPDLPDACTWPDDSPFRHSRPRELL